MPGTEPPPPSQAGPTVAQHPTGRTTGFCSIPHFAGLSSHCIGSCVVPVVETFVMEQTFWRHATSFPSKRDKGAIFYVANDEDGSTRGKTSQ